MPCHHYDPVASRRDFLRTAGCGFGAVALAALTRSPLLAASGEALTRNWNHRGTKTQSPNQAEASSL